MLLQVVWLFVVARTLGAEGYGMVAAVSGLALAIGGFAAFGLGLKLYQDVARDGALLNQRMAAVSWALSRGLPVLALAFVLLSWSFPAELEIGWILALGFVEIAMPPVATQAGFAFAASGRMALAAAAGVAAPLARVLAALAFVAAGEPFGIRGFVLLHALALIALLAPVWPITCAVLSVKRTQARPSRREMGEGLGFAALWASSLGSTSLDKWAAVSAGGAKLGGEYAAGQRIGAVFALPIESLAMVVTPRLFRLSGGQPLAPGKMTLLFLAAVAYAGAAALIFFLTNEWIVGILGPEFSIISEYAPLLACWVAFFCVRVFSANLLLALERKQQRVAIEIMYTVALVALLAVLVPSSGLGAGFAAMALVEMLSALLMVAVVSKAVIGRRRERQSH
ncbi:lipopolysaccharide biosynthesis protein [Pseudomarimonas salicorniae]|uniref:Membrane protein involved in the export of O-antigen and teichoic acid n=1 Tax=Pseudomarimonas salicorniae TaxID=2933270 RepID=A0ABT0GFL8_9GAMM|nr:hypothetical protein [Lysobacter sp. CAU 1642]MCK7593335.1 hypothetical protein [Lysobacter sp. CAU 1642]